MPRILFGSQSGGEQIPALGRVGHAVRRPQDVADGEAVLGQGPGLVGDDEIDRAEGLLGAQAAHQHAAPQQPVGAKPEDDRQEHRRLLGDRGDRRRDARDQVRPDRIAASEPGADGDRDEPDRHDQQDPDEPSELALQRRPAALGRCQPAGDAAELGRRPGRDHDPLTATTDDRRPRERERSALGQGGPRFIRLGRGELRDRFPGQDAAIDEEPCRRCDPQVRGHDLARAQQHDVARDQVRGRDVGDDPIAADTSLRGGGVAERGEGALRPEAGGHVRTDDGEEPDEDQQPVADLAERDRQGPGHEEQDDERLGDGLEDRAKDRRARHGLQLVRPDLRPTLEGGRTRQSDGRVDSQGVGDVDDRSRVRIRGHGRRCLVLHASNRPTHRHRSVRAIGHVPAARSARVAPASTASGGAPRVA